MLSSILDIGEQAQSKGYAMTIDAVDGVNMTLCIINGLNFGME
jgi:hypothetical protein